MRPNDNVRHLENFTYPGICADQLQSRIPNRTIEYISDLLERNYNATIFFQAQLQTRRTITRFTYSLLAVKHKSRNGYKYCTRHFHLEVNEYHSGGLLVNLLESYLPLFMKRLFLYGKYSTISPYTLAATFEVPKRWFRHFYIFCAPAMTITLCLVLYKYLYNTNIPEIVFTLLDTLLGASRKPLIPAEDAILAFVIYNIHCWKRLYESHYVSVFSNQTMHFIYYLFGYTHYIGIILCIIGESEGFVRGSYANMNLHNVTTIKLICALICLWSSYIQLKTNFILANLRKNTHGDVVSLEYKIPFDGLFKYITGPLPLLEILVYLMLSVILWPASTYHYITYWVIANQVECAFMAHQWYRNTFENYPKERKILIPFIW